VRASMDVALAVNLTLFKASSSKDKALTKRA